MTRVDVVIQREPDSRLAHLVNTVKMAAGFAAAGCTVRFVSPAPHDRRSAQQVLHEDHHAGHLEVVPLRLPRLARPPRQRSAFLDGVRRHLRTDPPDLLYARDYEVPVLAARSGIDAVAETHAHVDDPNPALQALLDATQLDSLRAVVTISPTLRDHYVQRGALAQKVVVLPTGADEPQDAPTPWPRPRVATYAGHLYAYKGIDTILGAARIATDVSFVLVGGRRRDQLRVRLATRRHRLNNVHLLGSLPPSRMTRHLREAGTLLLPPSAHHPSAAWTSPVKLGEYLASGTPVVATAIPAIRHWLDEESAVLVPPDSPAALAEAVQALLADPARSERLAHRGQNLARTWSYRNRAQAILDRAGVED